MSGVDLPAGRLAMSLAVKVYLLVPVDDSPFCPRSRVASTGTVNACSDSSTRPIASGARGDRSITLVAGLKPFFRVNNT